MTDNGDLVARLACDAVAGDQSSWRQIVRRYTPLVRSVCRRYRLTVADADDVEGVVWLQLVIHLANLRTPAALPGWLSITAQRQCHALIRHRNRRSPLDERDIADTQPEPDVGLVHHERRTALRDAIAALPNRDRQLLSMLFSDPPTPYTRISTTLHMPIGTIGPTRQRCLARLRRNPAVAALLTGAGT